ncbi:histone-lysine N-methyltransferase H3 lysine-9 specific SUVH8-like [Tripterygium wilfordii]|uniref:Histone-lysine N-methyltransferase H3 lysine-9 specific SUVH8-like n=1 Tax=Tripterygium wilfordii TaxID=458696 RepID=A0A7J7C696_TRIWF|nr:histone-lysine N-methyltransferase H3 lysine-9 specific SUVH8-like [Tripterygium wilfordii]
MGFVDSVVHAKSTRVCNLSSSSYSEARSGRKMMENDHFPSHISLPVYKQRGVSAVRDFPPGCGRFATGSSLRPDKDEAPNNTVENLEGTYKDGSIQLSETGFGTQSTCAQKSSVCVEMLGQQDTSESEFERLKSSAHPKYGLMSVDIKQMEAVDLSEGVGALDNARLFTPLEAFEQETCAIVNDFCQVDDAALDEELVPPSDLGLLPLHNDSAAYPNGNDLEKTLARSYPPRRRVSAVRDFPPNCGRNVPFLNEEKHLEVLDSSERKCLGQEKFNSEDEPLKGTMQTNVKGMGVDVGREDDQTSKLEGYKPKSVRDEVKVESEGRPSKRIGKQDKIITALENKKLKTAVRMDKSVAEGLGKDSVGFTKVKTVDQNVADLSGSENHLQDEDCEVLKFSSEMAASNSPCRLVKGSSKANVAGGIAKSTGKKHHPLLLERYKSAVKPRKVKAEKSGGTFSRRRSSSTQNAFPAMHQLVASDVKNSTRQDEVSHVSAHNIDVSLPPSWPIGLIGKSNDSDGNVTRNKPELAWKEVKQSKKLKVRNGVCVDDISQGKEPIPISAVNTIDDEKPPSFKYVTGMIYPDWYHSLPPKGCDCLNGCLEGKCSCVAKNGGEIPYNHNGAIVETKPLVYECGPSCKCPHSCYNRVSQLGIKFQLEIFKTESRGWGLRSLDFIHSGSFIGEYAGELLEENEAEKRTGMDEYLFDIGDNYNDGDLWNELSTMMHETQSTSHEVVECVGFTIDAARYGNVGRFINHSCSPNLYAQNVLYDHEDKRIPHIMMFAAENIPPLKELTYHYNYKIDQVYDSDGNVKKKSCYCGSSKCTDWCAYHRTITSPHPKGFVRIFTSTDYRECATPRLKDLNERFLHNRWQSLKFVQLAQFAVDHLMEIVQAYFGMKAKAFVEE